MTEANTTNVVYRAIADFSDLRRRINSARRSLNNLKKAEAEYNKSAVAGAKTTAAAQDKATKATQDQAEAFEDAAINAGNAARQVMAQAAAARQAAKDNNALAESVNKGSKFQRDSNAASRMAARGFGAQESAARRLSTVLDRLIRQYREHNTASQTLSRGVDQLHRSFVRLGNWRPRLIPPFIALVPVIAAVAGALNPLVALLGSAGAAAIGFANALGSLTGVALALPGILSGIVAGVSSVIMAFGGMGNVFRAYGQLSKANAAAAGSGSTGRSAEDRALALEDAEERLSDAQRSAARAQQNLNRARQQALKDLVNLRIEVSRASLNEERALANLQLAREAYYNVLAEPGSTSGDKLDALASLKEAEADLEDVRRTNIENAAELAEAERKGVEGSDEVVDAKEALSDSLREVRRAQIDLRKETTGVNDALAGPSGAATAASLFNEELAKLSPSAQAFVLGLIGMQDAWKAMRREVQEAFFSNLVDDLDRIRGLIPVIGNLWIKAAGAMGRVVSRGIEMLSSGPWTDDFGRIADSNVKIIEDLGDGFFILLDAMRHLVVAAAPFTEWLTGSLKEGTENFRDMVQAGRESGDLAAWLEKVRGRLEKWWAIVKNIGATIFNYGAAASDFGDWITDGMLRMTESWKAASEEARKEGSPFRTWLEDTKPVLSELKGLFGDFFGWFAREASNPDNLKDAQDLLVLFRDELGPAISRFLDTLAETDIDEKLVSALSSILDSITKILEKGGNAAFETFFEVITGFFESIADFVDSLPPGALEPLLKVIGAIAGLALISKFPGVSLLFAGFAKLLGSEYVLTKLLDKLGGLATKSWKGMKDAFDSVVAAGKAKLPSGAAPGAGGGAGTFVAGAAKLGAVGAIVAGVVSALQGPVVENAGDNFGKFGQGDVQGGLNGFSQDIMKGNPFGLGQTIPIFDSIFGTDISGFWEGLVEDFWTDFAEPTQENIKTFFTELPSKIAAFAVDVWTGIKNFPTWLAEQWQAVVQWFIDLPYNIGLTAGNIWNLVKSFGAWLGEQWEGVVTWFSELPTKISETAGDVWALVQTIGTWLGLQWEGFKLWLITRPEAIKTAAGDLFRSMQGIPAWLGEQWTKFTTWLTTRPEAIKTAAGNLFRDMGSIGTWLGEQWTKFTQWLNDIPSKIAKTIGNFWDWVFSGVTKGWSDSQTPPGGDAPGGSLLQGIRGPGVGGGGPAQARVSAALKSFPGLRITDTLSSPARDAALGLQRSPNSYHYDARNPAVDIAGPIPMLHQLYRVLVGMGGWRQMLWQVPGHYDHIHVANKGGRVPGRGNGDTVKSLLTPGEFVVRKEIVNRIGADNMARLNSGVLSYQQLLERAFAAQPRKSKGSGFGFDGMGLAPSLGSYNPAAALSAAPDTLEGGNTTTTIDQRTIVENLNVHNPKRETASDSLPRSIRKLAYTTSGTRSGR